MVRFAFQRIIRSILTLWIVVTVVFVALRLSGDPATMMLGPDAPAEALRAFQQRNRLEDPLLLQYLRYFQNLAQGDLGQSLKYNVPVSSLFFDRVPATLELAGTGFLIAAGIGIPVGILAALRHNTRFDRFAMFIAFLGQSAPGFFIGIMLILLLSLRLGWLPSFGRGGVSHLIMPSITLAVGLLASLARMTRSSLLEISHADYIRTARAKGLATRPIVVRHMLRNAAIPVVTMLGLWVSGVLGGAAVTETVFAWPGIGRLLVEAISSRDYPIVQSLVLIIATTVIVVNLLVDLLYGWLDPRVSVVNGAR